jgi:hypothetical protein
MLLLVVALVSSLALSAEVAVADAVYHSKHISVTSVGGAPLRSGFVENIHVNGPTIYAHEVYVLNGATPNATYHVQLNGYLSSAACSGSPDLVIPAANLATNAAGNGKAQAFFHPSDVAGLNGMTVHIVWTLTRDGAAQPAYTTGCETVVLD